MEQPSPENPYRETERRLSAELDFYRNEQHRAEALAAEMALKARVREDAIKALTMIIKEAPKEPERAMSLLPGGDSKGLEPLGETTARFTATFALRGLAREGYGAISAAVLRMLNYNRDGLSAKVIADVLKRNGFKIKGDDYEAAVRSALKNLRSRGLASHNEETGRYQGPLANAAAHTDIKPDNILIVDNQLIERTNASRTSEVS
jgi:hypothetical protein